MKKLTMLLVLLSALLGACAGPTCTDTAHTNAILGLCIHSATEHERSKMGLVPEAGDPLPGDWQRGWIFQER